MKTCECGCGSIVRRRFLPGHNPVNRNNKNRIASITKHGMHSSREYQRYSQAKQRCQNPKCKRFDSYGGRGIEFRFKSFEEFYKELGPCPEGKTLDRIENDGHYEIGNVRWATKEQQYASRRPWCWRKKLSGGENGNS